jgi:hypothetical protein
VRFAHARDEEFFFVPLRLFLILSWREAPVEGRTIDLQQ